MKKLFVLISVLMLSLYPLNNVIADIDPIENGVTILLDSTRQYTQIMCKDGELVIDKGESDTIIVRCETNTSNHIVYLPFMIK